MVKWYLNIVLKLLGLGAIIAAAGLWAGAGVLWRPKRRDEQTLIGGTIWSQIIIPIGLLISMSINQNVDLFVHSYYLLTGVAISFMTGIVLVFINSAGRGLGDLNTNYGLDSYLVEEYKTSRSFGRQSIPAQIVKGNKYDPIYLSIGVLSLIAGILTLIDFILLLVI